METTELKVFDGDIVRKCTLEHFEKNQWLYGSPYFYLVRYDEKHSGTGKELRALWKFNTETLKYELYQTVERESSGVLKEIADKWEKELWDERIKRQNGDYEE
jgi:hypothetical protein